MNVQRGSRRRERRKGPQRQRVPRPPAGQRHRKIAMWGAVALILVAAIGGLLAYTGTSTKTAPQSPAFAMSFVDGSKVTSDQLLGEGRPVFLYFFATW